MNKYLVVVEIEVRANTPLQAATKARDAMLDPDNHLPLDVHDIQWHEEAWDWIPRYDHGWQARFEDGRVRPTALIAWERIN